MRGPTCALYRLRWQHVWLRLIAVLPLEQALLVQPVRDLQVLLQRLLLLLLLVLLLPLAEIPQRDVVRVAALVAAAATCRR